MQVQYLGWEDSHRRKWQPTPVFLLGKSHGQRSLAGNSLWGCKRVRHDLTTKQQHLTSENEASISGIKVQKLALNLFFHLQRKVEI